MSFDLKESACALPVQEHHFAWATIWTNTVGCLGSIEYGKNV